MYARINFGNFSNSGQHEGTDFFEKHLKIYSNTKCPHPQRKGFLKISLNIMVKRRIYLRGLFDTESILEADLHSIKSTAMKFSVNIM